MPDNSLLKEVTRYGDQFRRISEVLYYASDRTVVQYKKMRMYYTCWLGLQFIKLGLPKVPFYIECDENEDVKLIGEKMFKRIWERLIRESLEDLDFGFKTFENRFEVGKLKYNDENGTLQTFEGILLKSPKGLDPETIEILIEGDGSFKGFRQDYEIARTCLAEDKKALVFTHMLESGNYYGISALEPIFPQWYDANLNRQFHMRWLERIGNGLFKGRYPVGETKVGESVTDNQTIMLDLLDGIMEGSHVALPSGSDENGNLQWDIIMLEAKDITDPFVNRAKYIDEAILKGLIIPEKALTQGEVGARASIESFQDMFIQRKQDILDQHIDIVDKYLFAPFVELNFGPDIDAHIKAGKLDDDSKSTANLIIQKLIENGREKVEQQWLIDKTGIPLEEREEFPEEIVPEEIPVEEEQIPDQNPENTEEEKEEFSDKYSQLSRREKQYNMADMGYFLDDQSNLFKTAMEEEILKQADRIKNYLDKNYGSAISGKYISIVDGIEIKENPIKKIIKNYLDEVYRFVFDAIQSGVEGYKYAGIDSPSAFIGFRGDLTGSKISSDLESIIKYQVSSDISSSISKPELLSRMIQSVRDFISSRMTTLSETELGFVLGKSNDDYFLLNQKLISQGKLNAKKKIQRFQFSAILDGVTTDLCRKLYTQFGPGGLIVEAGSPIKAQYNTPLHFNCRSVWLPVTVEEIEDPRYEETDLTMGNNNRPITIQELTTSLGTSINQKTFCEDCSC